MTSGTEEKLLQLSNLLLPKWEQFLIEYLKNDGNATEAAMIVFNCKSRQSAQAIGSKYLKKATPHVRAYLEQQGFTYGRFIEIALEKMSKSKKTDWWDRLMVIGGYYNFISK